MHSPENNESSQTRKEDEAQRHKSIDRILLEALKLLENYLGRVAVEPEETANMVTLAGVHTGVVEVGDLLCVGCPVDEVVHGEGI